MSKLGRTCTQCQGETTRPTSDSDPTPVPCVACDSTGYEKIGEVDNSDIKDKINDLSDKVNDVLDKCDEILEALNP